MKGRILSELYVGGILPLLELQRRCRIGVDYADKTYSELFRNTFFELLNTRVIQIDFEDKVMVCPSRKQELKK
jgi:hypothetical protein